jgi:hypothetical protein
MEDTAEVVVGFGQSRLEGECAGVRCRSFIQFALGLEDGAQVGMISRDFLVDSNGLADHLEGRLVTSSLVCDHPEQMQAVCLLGIDGENLAIDALGLGQSAGPVVPETVAHESLNQRGGLG